MISTILNFVYESKCFGPFRFYLISLLCPSKFVRDSTLRALLVYPRVACRRALCALLVSHAPILASSLASSDFVPCSTLCLMLPCALSALHVHATYVCKFILPYIHKSKFHTKLPPQTPTHATTFQYFFLLFIRLNCFSQTKKVFLQFFIP